MAQEARDREEARLQKIRAEEERRAAKAAAERAAREAEQKRIEELRRKEVRMGYHPCVHGYMSSSAWTQFFAEESRVSFAK